MALTVAGSIATGVTELSYPHAYRISYPEFLDHMNALGIPAAVSGGVPALGQPAMILDDLDRHARERPGERAVVEISADGTVRELSWGALRMHADGVASELLRLGVLRGRARRVPAPEPPRVRDGRPGHAAGRRGVRAADADFPRARAVVHAPRKRRARPVRSRSVPRPRLRGDGRRAAGGVALARARCRARTATRRPATVAADAAPSPDPDQIAQLLFTSGTSGEPKGALHRHDALMRAADHHIDHFGLGSGDVVYVPSPLAHQTGFLYGMWIAIRLGVPQVLQETWDAEVGLETMRAVRRDVRAGRDPVPGRPHAGGLGSRPGRVGASPADVRGHRRRDPPRAGAPLPRGPRRRGRRGVGHDRELSRLRVRARRSARARLGHRRPRACRLPLRVVDDEGQPLSAGRGGQLRGPRRLPVRGLPEPARS